jgi:arsenate reductase
MKGHYNVLFVCTGNSARSQMAEVVMNQLGRERFTAYSAGSRPTGVVHPVAIETLQAIGLPTDGLRSKSWSEFAVADAPVMDFIITVCDRAAGETCPIWPGHPITAHWSVPDPAGETGTPMQVRRAFGQALAILQQRIALMLALRVEALDRLVLATQLNASVAPPASDA